MEACVVERSTPRSPDAGGLGFKPRPSSCFLRQLTLLHFVSLWPGVGTGEILLGGNPAMD